ncbi:MAG: metallophosphoesterase, partial [Alphaproteobacteria bacterium]
MRAEFKARQLQIVHLSDLHFGDSHRFRPEAAADGIRPRHAPAPNVCDLLADDLQSLDFDVPTIVCVTGDIANHALTAEFDEAEEFLNKFLTIAPLTKTISKREVFLIPGNHDVTYDKENLGHRWQQWTEF